MYSSTISHKLATPEGWAASDDGNPFTLPVGKRPGNSLSGSDSVCIGLAVGQVSRFSFDVRCEDATLLTTISESCTAFVIEFRYSSTTSLSGC